MSVPSAFDDDGRITITLGSHDVLWLRMRSRHSTPASPATPVIRPPQESTS